MISILLAICFIAFGCEMHFSKEAGRVTRSWIIVPSAMLGGLLSVAILFLSISSIFQEQVGKPGTPYFRIGKLVPIPRATDGRTIQFYLSYVERPWWGKGKAKSWRARWNEIEGEYEYLDGNTWRPLPVSSSRQDDREYAIDNRGSYEIQ